MNKPIYHFVPKRNWINDPNGLCYFGGKYHLFYQHYPYAAKWGTMHWGHAISDDMTKWEHLPIALFPTKAYDRDGVFSGSALIKDNKMYLYYTGIKYLEVDDEDITVVKSGKDFEACQAMIISTDGMSFDNFGAKKKIISPITNETVGHKMHTRDPKVWKFGDKYYMILGTKVTEKNNDDFTPRVLFYTSDDAVNWELLNHFEIFGELGNMWECPDIFTCADTVLVLSPEQMCKSEPTNNSVFGIVNFNNETCQIAMDTDDFRFIDYGLDYYAPQSFLDKDCNRVQIGWLRFPQACKNDDGSQWIGAMTMPRIVSTENGKIITRIHPNLKAKFPIVHETADFSKPVCISRIMKQGDKIRLPKYDISFDGKNIFALRNGKTYASPVCDETVRIEIYVDGCIVEIYINDGEAVITHIL